jgi:hypothetical protein
MTNSERRVCERGDALVGTGHGGLGDVTVFGKKAEGAAAVDG